MGRQLENLEQFGIDVDLFVESAERIGKVGRTLRPDGVGQFGVIALRKQSADRVVSVATAFELVGDFFALDIG